VARLQLKSLAISIRGLTKRYGSVAALDAVDLDIRAGEFLTLLGPSGSGKTTLLMTLAGFARPDAGAIFLGERELTFLPPHQRGIGVVFQSYALFPHMTVLANVSYPLRVRGFSKSEIHERARRALDLVQLSGFEDRAISQLSGGQAQRVALARAIVFEPPVLLMDEPLSALDRKLRETMQTEIRRIHERVGATTIYVTHDQREALALSDRVVVFNTGRIEQIGTPEDVYDRPSTLFVADFVGDSHFIPVTVEAGVAQINGRALKLAQLTPLAPHQFLVLRPERLELGPPDAEAEYNRFDGKVLRRVFFGDVVVLTIGVADLPPITVKLGTNHRAAIATPPVGSTIALWLHRIDTILIPAVTSRE